MDSLSTGSLSGVQKEELMDQVKQQIAIANAQELLTKMSEKCFKKCINKPGTALDNSEQKCIAMCMDRYMDAWNLVSRTYSSRIQRERNNMWESARPDGKVTDHRSTVHIENLVVPKPVSNCGLRLAVVMLLCSIKIF